MFKNFFKVMALVGLFFTCTASSCESNDSDNVQTQQQETMLKEATGAVGMPAIKNFHERRLLKAILEMRDQEGLTTYTYTYSEMTGKLIFLCNSVGFGVPYATQFTNPLKTVTGYQSITTVAQADPNGLFSPASAEGTWVLCKNPKADETVPVYVEPRVIVSPFKFE